MNEKLGKLLREAELLARQGKLDEAIGAFTNLIPQATNQAEKSEFRLFRGELYLAKNEYDQAISDFDEVLNQNPDNQIARYDRGAAYMLRGEYDEAIPDFNEVLNRDPDNQIARYNRGVAYTLKGKYDEAISDFTEMLERSPSDKSSACSQGFNYAAVYIARGNVYSVKGEHDQAISDFNEAEDLAPDNEALYCNRGDTYLRKREYSQALSDYAKAIERNSEYADAYVGRGNVYNEMGKYDEALADYEKAEEYNPKDVNIYNNRAVIHNKKGEYDKAIDNYKELLKIDSDSVSAYCNLAMTYGLKGDYKEAFDNYGKALKKAPEHADAYGARGLLHHSCCIDGYLSGNYPEAEQHLQRAEEDFREARSKGVISLLVLSSAYLINEMKHLNSEERKKIYNLYVKVGDIKNTLFLGPEPPQVWHYCSLDTLKNLTQGPQSCCDFRLYNADYMNDPEEGEELLHVLDGDGFSVKQIFYKNNEEHRPISPAYIGSFTQKNEEELLLWMAYGKHDGIDAAGACLVFKSSAFSDKANLPLAGTPSPQHGFSLAKRMNSVPVPEATSSAEKIRFSPSLKTGLPKPDLFRVVYRGDIEKEKLQPHIDGLKEALNGLKEIKKAHGLVQELLDEIRFLFKSHDYKEEKEARVVIILPYRGENIKDYVKIDCDEFPPRFYIEPFKGEILEKIILGPQVRKGVSEWEAIVKRSEFLKDVKWEGKSKIKYGAK